MRRLILGLLALCSACGDEPAPQPTVAPDPPRALGPGAITGRTGLRPIFRWSAVDAAPRYELELGGCSAGVASCRFEPPIARVAVASTSWQPAGALPRGRYGWRVRACADSCSPWSPVRAIAIGGAVSDLDGDGLSDAVAGAPLADLGGRDRGAVIVARGPTLAATRLDEPAGHDGAEFGAAAAVGDVDADGAADLIVGAPGDGDGAGVAYLYAGRAVTGGAKAPRLTLADTSARPGDALGATIAVGDFDRDGFADVAVAAPGAGCAALCARDRRTDDPADSHAGRVLIWRGGPAGLDHSPPRTLTAPSPAPFDRYGAALATGDLDGDGADELIVGAPGQGRAGAARGVDRGAVYVYRGGITGLVDVPIELEAPVPLDHDRFGFAIAAGDLDGDDLADLIVGAPGADDGDARDGGLVYRFRGGELAAHRAPDQVVAIRAGAFARFGAALAVCGDVDGDGFGDAVVGVSRDGRGLALVYRGGREGLRAEPIELGDPAEAGDAPSATDDFGEAVAGVGDLDGDGKADVLVGAVSARDGRGRLGRIVVYRGARGGVAPAPLELDGPAEQAHFGRALAGR
ncbi:MAG: FG-GAP-like repeat-containing protein [Deltaproteobacteria bacterium]|nr:FG-GAP-like repeat-containing protein [Deltaproteobacteria bacterium]